MNEKKERLCVVMPVYNEQDAIGPVLCKWDTMLKGLGIDYEIRPYNDGSRDDSLSVMRKIGESLEKINVRDKPNGGHGNTILTGYRDAAADGFDWIFQVDSDDEMGPEKFGELWARRGEYDFLVGTRDGRRQAWPRKVISLVSRICVRLFYDKSVWDVNTPYRLMRVSAFRDFYRQIPLTTFAPNVILSGLAARHKLRSFEIPVPQRDRTTGEVSIKKWKLVRAALNSFCQTIEFSVSQTCVERGWKMFFALAVVSTALKFISSAKGWNCDFEAYNIVADIVNRGGNVYAETTRYNYGPPWFIVLGFIKSFTCGYFRYGIILLLSLADIGIAALLWRRRLFLPVILFLFSNVSIHISGCHNQFDNIAIFIALLAFVLIDSRRRLGFLSSYWLGVVLLGVSITVKHVFVFVPFWFLFRRTGFAKRVISFALPLLIFVSSFIPYSGLTDEKSVKQIVVSMGTAKEFIHASSLKEGLRRYYQKEVKPLKLPVNGIAKNVFMYRSSLKGSVYDILFPDKALTSIPTTFVFAFFMILLGFLSRKKSWFDCFLIYTLGMFVFSPGMAMQYYAVPAVAAAVCWCPFGFLYHLGAGMAFLIGQGGGTMFTIVIAPALLMVFGCLAMALRRKS